MIVGEDRDGPTVGRAGAGARIGNNKTDFTSRSLLALLGLGELNCGIPQRLRRLQLYNPRFSIRRFTGPMFITNTKKLVKNLFLRGTPASKPSDFFLRKLPAAVPKAGVSAFAQDIRSGSKGPAASALAGGIPLGVPGRAALSLAGVMLAGEVSALASGEGFGVGGRERFGVDGRGGWALEGEVV